MKIFIAITALCGSLFLTGPAFAIDPFLPTDPSAPPPARPVPNVQTPSAPGVIIPPDFSVCNKWLALAATLGWPAVAKQYEECVAGVVAEYKFPVPLYVPMDPWQP